MYRVHDVHSVEDLPVYKDVQQEVLPLGTGGARLQVVSAGFGDVTLHKELCLSRMRYHEIQQGETLYFGVFFPHGEAMRFRGVSYDDPFFVCWRGLSRTEYDYVLESGTQLFMLEVPIEFVRGRGWSIEIPPTPLRQGDKLNAFRLAMEAYLIPAQHGNGRKAPMVTSGLLDQLETLVGNQIFCPESRERSPGSNSSQWKIVSRAEAYLKENGNSATLSGQELCSALDVSKRTLYAAFEQQLGIGPGRLQMLIRLRRLRALLQAAPYEKGSVSRLIGEAGFSHLGRTSVVYRQHFGETPSETMQRSI